MDDSNDASSYTERTAMIYHHIRPFQVDGKYGDTKALQAGIDGLRKSLDGAGDDFTSKLSKYYIYQWLASALNSHGYITSCKLNITGFTQWLASNPSLQSLHAQEMQKRGDFTLCNNTWRDPADRGQYTF